MEKSLEITQEYAFTFAIQAALGFGVDLPDFPTLSRRLEILENILVDYKSQIDKHA